MISLLVCCPRTVQSDLFKAWVRSHLMVSRCHTEWNPSLCWTCGPLVAGFRTLPPPLSLTKLQSHRLPPCPGEHPPSASLLPAHRTVSFWTGLSPASLSLLTQVYAESTSPVQGISLITLLFTLLRFLPGLCTLFTARWSSNPHCLP